MPNPPPTRSVKIPNDERLGWSSDRPRRDGAPPRPADVSVRSRILSPSDRVRYSPGSLVVVVSASTTERDEFVDRVVEERAALLSLGKVRGLLAGRVPEDQVEAKAVELLDAAIAKRLEANESIVISAESLDGEERERYVRMAAPLRRPRHLILLEAGRDRVDDSDRAALNEIRRALDAGEMGDEGFQTAMRVGGGAVAELKRIVFRSASRDNE